MGGMRAVLLVLPLACLALAEDTFPVRLRTFEEAREKTLEPGSADSIMRAVEDLIATGDERAVSPLLKYLAETFVLENKIIDRRKASETQRIASTNSKRNLMRDLDFLRAKERAGDDAVGPEIVKRVATMRKLERSLEEAQEQKFFAREALDLVRGVRKKLAAGVTTMLKGLAAEKAGIAVSEASRALDATRREQAIYLVAILRDSARPEAEGPLLEIIANPKVDAAIVRGAQYALVRIMTRKGAEALLRLWEKDPDGRGKNVAHVLSLVARRKLEGPEDARKWVATLK